MLRLIVTFEELDKDVEGVYTLPLLYEEPKDLAELAYEEFYLGNRES